MKVLIVDDSEMMLKLLPGWFSKWDYEVVLATNGAEAWQIFQKDPVPLVLTDWEMPEVSGLELVQKIRGANLAGYVYIVIMTGRNDKKDLVEAMEAGADDYIPKPVHPGELRVRVRQGERVIRLERRLADQNRRLRETQAALVQSERLASLGQLAAGMAHEINNPISFVVNNLAVLKRDVTAAMAVLDVYRDGMSELREFAPHVAARAAQREADCDLEWVRENLPALFDKSREGLARVRKIVSDLRDFAHLDEAELDELDVNAALKATADVLHHEIEAQRLTVTMQLVALRPVLCHPGKINQVFHSLLLNAIQASFRGGQIALRAFSDEAGVVVEVEDHGCGIDPANLPRIFEPFFTTKPVGAGAGLGLAVCYGIIRDHGGSISVESEAGHGSTLRVRLPWLPAPVSAPPQP
jgi:signal transduction histidine kinase